MISFHVCLQYFTEFSSQREKLRWRLSVTPTVVRQIWSVIVSRSNDCAVTHHWWVVGQWTISLPRLEINIHKGAECSLITAKCPTAQSRPQELQARTERWSCSLHGCINHPGLICLHTGSANSDREWWKKCCRPACRSWMDVTWEGRSLTFSKPSTFIQSFYKQKREISGSEHKVLIKVKDSSFNKFSLCKDVTLTKILISS